MSHTLLGLPSVDPAALAAGDADAVVLGVPFGVPYPSPGPAAGCAEAPAAIRVMCGSSLSSSRCRPVATSIDVPIRCARRLTLPRPGLVD